MFKLARENNLQSLKLKSMSSMLGLKGVARMKPGLDDMNFGQNSKILI